MLRLGIISNPFAKMNKNNPEHNTQMWYSLANAGIYKITHSLEELENVCQEFFQRKINLVGIVGGDGSIGLVLSYLLKAYGSFSNLPKILLLKGGTINFLASNLGIHTSALTCLNDTLFFIRKSLSLYEISVRTIQVNDRIGFIFAAGIASTFLEEFYKNKTNSLGAAKFLARYFLDGLLGGRIDGSYQKIVQPQAFDIQTTPQSLWQKNPSQTSNNDYTLLFASSVPKLPFHFHLFKKISLQSHTAELIGITETGSRLVRSAFQAFIGGNINSFSGIDSVVFEEAFIESDAKIKYSLDGDLCMAENGKIDIKYGPSVVFCSPYYISNHNAAQNHLSKGHNYDI